MAIAGNQSLPQNTESLTREKMKVRGLGDWGTPPPPPSPPLPPFTSIFSCFFPPATSEKNASGQTIELPRVSAEFGG